MSLTGSGPDDPQRMGVPIGELLAGMYDACGVVTALHKRSTTGRRMSPSRPPTKCPEPSFPAPPTRVRLYEQVAEQISGWIAEHDLRPAGRLPAERELAARLGVSRATPSQALVALEVIGAVAVRHGDGTVVAQSPGATCIVEAVRAHAKWLPEIIETRDAMETKIAGLAAARRTETDLDRIEGALLLMEADVEAGGRGVEGDELFHAAVTAASHSLLLSQLMAEIADLIRETRIESLSQPGRPRDSLVGHRAIAGTIRDGNPEAAARTMHAHVVMVSDVAVLRPW